MKKPNILQGDEWQRLMNRWGHDRQPFAFAIAFKGDQAVCGPCDDEASGVLYDFPKAKYLGATRPSSTHQPCQWQPHPVSRARYTAAFEMAMRRMQCGEVSYINLTFPTPISCNLSLREIFHRTHARYRMYVPDLFTVFSPEPFVQIEGETIRSFPMKGTIDANTPNAMRRVLDDPKEAREHSLAVQLVSDDLSRVARDVRIARYRYVERVRTGSKDLLEVSSEVTGHVGSDWHERIGTLLRHLLPGGSILGSPREAARGAIEEIEPHPRGFYTGICGHYDGQTLDSAVLIRFIAQQGERLVFHSGGGITTDSLPEREYQELIDKVYIPIT